MWWKVDATFASLSQVSEANVASNKATFFQLTRVLWETWHQTLRPGWRRSTMNDAGRKGQPTPSVGRAGKLDADGKSLLESVLLTTFLKSFHIC